VLLWIGLVAFGATGAHAQVFRPRTGVKTGPVARTAPSAPAPAATSAAPKKATPATTSAAAPAKKPIRATGPAPHRVVTTTPAKRSHGARKGKGESDDPVVVDDDDDDVKVSDD
jgi:hypothetical protein